MGEGHPDSDHTVLFHSRPPPALLFLVALQETAGHAEELLSELLRTLLLRQDQIIWIVSGGRAPMQRQRRDVLKDVHFLNAR